AADLNMRDDRKERPKKGAEFSRQDSREPRSGSGDFKKLFINMGTKDGFYKASFLQFILDMSDLRKDVLGKIDMREMNSWVEIESRSAQQMIRAIDGKKFKGRKIRMNEADGNTFRKRF
ncbi:MAG: DbpA RNA binding domain-containing protein, partial [Bacteroidota bacterium]